jgi:diguanylate cyclase (GGDEF)-like protein
MNISRSRIWRRTALVTTIAVAATYALSFSTRFALGMPIDWLAWVECFVIPVVVATPVGYIIFTQAEKLRCSNQELRKRTLDLSRAHDELKSAHARLTHISQHDQMTGLLNRESFMKILRQSLEEVQNATLLIVDADHFKSVNDRFGHLAGDEALVQIAEALRQTARKDAVVARIGGEEFGVLLMHMFPHEAEAFADLLRRQIERIQWQHAKGKVHQLTVSIGGAHLNGDYTKIAEALRDADRCLYWAKRRGRNRVEFEAPKLEAA